MKRSVGGFMAFVTPQPFQGARDLTPRFRAAPLHGWSGALALFSSRLPPVGGEKPPRHPWRGGARQWGVRSRERLLFRALDTFKGLVRDTSAEQVTIDALTEGPLRHVGDARVAGAEAPPSRS